jgi:hypothetical protein
MYVGITTNPALRWCKHRNGHGSYLVKAAIAKYGIENFRFTVIYQSCDGECVKWMEQQAIAELKTEAPFGYNRNSGGGGAPKGVKPSVEIVARRAASNRGKKRVAGFGERMAAINKGRKRTIGVRQRLSEIHRGHPGYQRQRDAARQLMSRCVLVDNVAYPSMKIAASQNGLSYSSLHKRFRRYEKSGSFPTGWAYLS